MSAAYDDYLFRHRLGVYKGIEWMGEHGILNEYSLSVGNFNYIHDKSKDDDKGKDDDKEYWAYDGYFYVSKDSYQEAFDMAWLEHIHKNEHHWQHWVLIRDEGELEPKDMPMLYVFEMIADWWSFSWMNGNLKEIFTWYDEHRNKMILSETTRYHVERILKLIENELEGNNYDA